MKEDRHAIEVEDLVVAYGDKVVLDRVSFSVRPGEIFVILGGSGSGKTTLLRTLVGLMRPRSGRIAIHGQNLTAMSDEQQMEIRRKIGMCFQGAALLGSLSVADNVALPLREHTRLEESTIDIMTRIKLELVGLGGAGELLPSELSGGMRKRAGIARAMAMDPEIIFYDEPSAGLDPIVAAGIDELIRNLRSTFSLTSVVVTHEMESVRLIADRVCMLHRGRVAGIGTLAELEGSDDPYIRDFLTRRPAESDADETEWARSLTAVD
ncbi:MAG: ABC transporter ATP-binding protein [Thermoanaerobaculales bacterium]|jgi:phospholipid/cholesterol/gamma-HCH transport system ATP-binding protein|nr:ABC transporter ATP-binding protein [Thermoanaerobaculales bacterium]